ncbi:MAG: zinc ribbon domain-containing protein [Chloroflexi bacterium]|nr:zinc ribbon domain-containing protein [Chloroflexota bacterium]
MPEYDFRCDACQHRFSQGFKTYALYDAACLRCPACQSKELTRLISQVAIPKTNRDYRRLSSREMLSVLESGEGRQVDEMFRQVSGGQSDSRAAPASPDPIEPADSA